MKNTILSEKDSILIEQTILRYGRIATTRNLLEVFRKEYSDKAASNRIKKLVETGWLKRVKRGLFLVNESISSRFQNDHSFLLISNTLNQNSYISLSYALNYYQMFDQYSKTIVAITTTESKKYNFDGYLFKFTRVKESMYFGYSVKMENGRSVKIADVEKALIDYLYLDNSFTSASLVFEKLKEFRESLDLEKMQDYAQKVDITLKRKIGFLLDQLNVDTQRLHQGLKGNKGFSRFTKESNVFNAKWRIYYDHRIIG
jgi:predicted transcriptional regulator of viral defense system